MRPIGAILCLALPLTAAGSAFAQTTWFVDAFAVPPGNGSSTTPYASIQYAHDQAATLSGDSLSIAPGDYAEPLSFSQGKALRLVGAGAGATLLTGSLTVGPAGGTTRVEDLTVRGHRVVVDSANIAFERVVIEGVHDFASPAVLIADADSTWTDVSFDDNYGALWVGASSPPFAAATLTNVTFTDCSGFAAPALRTDIVELTLIGCSFSDNVVSEFSGGAVSLLNSETTIEGCTFTGNQAISDGAYGGAILLVGGSLALSDSTLVDNLSSRGGALALTGTAEATIDGVTFEGNRALGHGLSKDWQAQGGAVWIGSQAKLTADGCTFRANSAVTAGLTWFEEERGGALFGGTALSTIRSCLFESNVAGHGGSAVHSAAALIRCRIQGNLNTDFGSTVHFAHLDRCTVVQNVPAPGGVAVLDGSVANSILWANPGAQLGGSSWAVYSCIQGGSLGAGNIAADPQFTDLDQGDLTLALGSPCIDAASPSAPLDPDLTPADMGALPFAWQPIGASYCSTNPNSSGQTASIAALGSASVADDFLRVQATHTALDQVGLFMMSQNQGFVPFFNGSQGNLCVSAPIFRLTNTPGSVSSSGAQGLLNLRVGLTTLPAGLQILPGQTWHFQSWFRDHVSGNPTSNTSDAVSVTFQ